MTDPQQIILAHGGGGELTRRLIDEEILPRLGNNLLNPLGDSALLPRPDGPVCMTTDAYVVDPLVFPGGDIGRLAVCGTVNDLAVAGAQPLAMSLAMVLEEGLDLQTFRTVLDSIARAGQEAGVVVATGDTKVVEQRGGPGMTITTAGLGVVHKDVRLLPTRIAPGDALLLSGRLAEHGLAVMSVRRNLSFQTDLRSDVAPLNELTTVLLDCEADVKFMRDPTRGGLAGVVTDLAEQTALTLEVDESAIPLSPAAKNTADMLGLDPLTVANEGKLLAVVAGDSADRALEACRSHPLGRQAAIVGHFTDATPPLAELITRGGGRRVIQRPYGEELPRIC